MFTNNASCWLGAVDRSGVSVAGSAVPANYGGLCPATAVTALHCVTAAHVLTAGIWATGDTIYFIGNDGIVVTRTIASTHVPSGYPADPTLDFAVLTLNLPLPASVVPMEILPSNFLSAFPSGITATDLIHFSKYDQGDSPPRYGEVDVFLANSLSGTTFGIASPRANPEADYSLPLEDGDSGSPFFLLVGGSLVLVGCVLFNFELSSIIQNLTFLDTTVTADGYSLTHADFSAYSDGSGSITMNINAAASADWDTTSTWVGGVIPASGDTVDLKGFTVTRNSDPAEQNGTLTINDSGNSGVFGAMVLAMTSGTPYTLTWSGNAAVTVTQPQEFSTSTVALTGINTISANLTLDDACTWSFPASGTHVVTATITVGDAQTGNGNSTLNIPTGCTVSCSGTGSILKVVGSSDNSDNGIINIGGIVNFTGAANAALIQTKGIINITGTVHFSGNGSKITVTTAASATSGIFRTGSGLIEFTGSAAAPLFASWVQILLNPTIAGINAVSGGFSLAPASSGGGGGGNQVFGTGLQV